MFQKIWGVIFFLAFSPAVWAYSYDFCTGGIYYNLTSYKDKTVKVTYKSYSGGDYSGDVTIPATVSYNGKVYSVTAIGSDAFYKCDGLTSVMIPESVTTIGDKAFYNCDNLTEITIPGSVIAIGESAFYSCDSLKAVTIGNGVTAIGDDAFYWCKCLTEITIPGSVTTIGSRAFYSCDSLKAVTISNGVTTIGDDAFSNCDNLTEITIPGSVTTIGSGAFYSCDSLKAVTISNGVTTIGDDAFSNCDNLTEITIPESVTTIGKSAFYSCDSLKAVTIGNGVTAIGDDAFYWCKCLTEITIPGSVTTIGKSAFSSCDSLKSVTIGNGVTTIGKYAFYSCDNLTEITIPESVTTIGAGAFGSCYKLKSFIGNFASDNGCCLIVNDTLVAFAPKCEVTKYIIPDGVTTIGDYAFSYSSLRAVTIPESVTTIGNYAFVWCDLESVPIGEGVTSIGDYAFSYCLGLTSVTISENVTTIGENAFFGCWYLTEITIPESVTTIGYDAFKYCKYLTRIYFYAKDCRAIDWDYEGLYFNLYIYIGKNVKYIPTITGEFSNLISFTVYFNADSCVGGCFNNDAIRTVHIGENVKYIPTGIFSGCTSLEKFEGKWASSDQRCLIMENRSGSGTIDKVLRFFAPSGLSSYTIPDSVTSIGSSAFYDCTELESVTIPESVTTIGYDAFSGCSGLKEVWFNADSCISGGFSGCSALATVHIGKNVKRIPNNAFSGCSSLTSITIPNSVTSIGSSAFEDCTGLTDVAIPESVTSIGSSAFYGCTGLTSVTIPESVTSIGSSAFSGCTGLTSVTIRESVTSIGSSAFYGCTGLTSVTIPESVTSIGSSAFSGCTGLRTITSLDSIPPRIYSSTFDNDTYKNATVNYPKGSLHAYKTATGWENFTYPTAQALLNPQLLGTVGETTYHCTVSYTRDIDYPVWRLTFRMGEEQFTLDTAQTSIPITVTDLEPQTEYEAKFFVETKYGDLLTCETSFTTDTVKLTTLPAINISNTSATLTADIACDAVIGAGFEWRRYDDPELVPSTLSETPIVDGKISGTLRNLSPEKYYKYRPFYRTVKGKYYYGAWLAFGTRDVYAYFEPTVSTRSGEVHGNNSTISGYIVEGSDELLSQGFEYWAETPVTRSTESIATRSTASEPERIEGSGTLMSVTLTGLDYNTTYYYRAYATTAKKTTYGNTESFTTGKAPVVQDFKPTGITPTDNSEVEALKTFTLEFEETPSLAVKAQTITLAGNDTLLTATLSAGSGNTLAITLADTLKTAGEYTLTIPEGTFGDADFADDPTVGHCNPELVYTYTIKEPEPVEPDEPENPNKPDEPIVPDEPDEPSSITETQAEAEHIAVYNLQGVLVLETDDAAALKTLQNGAYIVNGKKMIIAR